MGKKPLLKTGDKYRIKFKTLRRMDSHELNRVLTLLGLVITCLK